MILLVVKIRLSFVKVTQTGTGHQKQNQGTGSDISHLLEFIR
jgi:hypothetical protein